MVNQGRRGTREEDARSSNFRWENLHLEIGAKGDLGEDFPGRTNLDFKHREVRDERFNLIEEVLQNYPLDGFELNLNYSSPAVAFFHPRETAAGRKIMTAWIRRVYRAVKGSGADRELAIRVPHRIERCESLGLDVREWMRQGIVDVLIGESDERQMDQTADFRPLVQAAQGAECRVQATIQCEVNSDRLDTGIIEQIRAVACNYWRQGVDGLYLAQWFTAWPYEAPFCEQLRELPHPDVMAYKDKFYFVPRARNERDTGKPLPRTLAVNQTEHVDFPVADDLARWDKAKRVHEVLLRLRLTGTTEEDQIEFRLNGKKLPDRLLRKINRIYRMKAPRYRVFSYWYIYRLDREHWPRLGDNRLEAKLRHRVPDLLGDLQLSDVELEVNYRGGKNFARGFQDPDEGPYVRRKY